MLCYNFDAMDQSTTFDINKYFADIINSAGDIIIGKDLDGNIVSWNRGAEKEYGYKADEVIGKNISILVTPGNENEIIEILKKIKAGQTIEHYETVRKTKDGRNVDVSISVSPIKDSDGNIIGASTIGHDITNSKLIENENKEKYLEIERLNKMMTDRELKMIELKKENAELKEKLENK
jgi:PAS domain S-box-containing protein